MEYKVNSITSANIMYVGVVHRFDYVSTVITKDMRMGAMDHSAKANSQAAAMTI